MADPKVCEDLIKERKKCTFDVTELTNLIDGGAQGTEERHYVENLVLSTEGLSTKNEVPEEYLSHKERYEYAIKKACILYEVLKEYAAKHNTMDAFKPTNKYRVTFGVVKDISPFMLHMGMFVPTILNQSDPEQMAEWLPQAMSMGILGTYAQTELGHGTFLRGLETTATYDPATEEFVLHTPTLTAYKWWPGGLAHTANHCIVVAQLYSKGECYGVHPFFVQIRDTDTHMPLPGVKVGEIGPKMGFQTANNGFLGFDHFRIPRRSMLMKNAQVLKDGTYVKSKNDKLTYGTMVFVRVLIVTDVAYELSRAATIAVRYSAVRHQSQPKPGEPEPQILDYVTQQHKLFIGVATSHVFRVTGYWLWDSYSKVIADVGKGNMDQLPELHALACCLKAVCSRDATARVEEFRLACGGHGFMASSNLPIINGIVAATITYEGEYTVLMLQTARFLVKAWKQATLGNAMTPTVSYLLRFFNNDRVHWETSPEGIVSGFLAIAAGKTKAACESLQEYEKSGMDYEDAWNSASVQLVNASEAHCRAILCEVSWRELSRLAAQSSPSLGKVLLQMGELYLIYWALEKRGDLLLYSTITRADIAKLQARYEVLLGLLRPNAVGLVDAFDIKDEILNSTLGAYDGRVYERLMEEALKSPLNAEPVNQSFHKYLKPLMMKAKL
ncbi:probable peroxisomal acyl-coenzyme A oxidase 1 [Spodoptera litura]|uniref:Acyl-coenzyme A oxidase n=1 Tax=Spodoptera litura TaxID=69820 RepID=A0A9J7E3H8_SPOLT|nr:probable peroxisomal acyl-coenzyme A oxidase 1 [Spodoptera litura]XP_022821683.1 probable peroxisomal acyl-coenzyme A oxidase 1 [Spodoptera litura]XP_022821684.1 probable peroxisomal acyl-coenzyme A oxidase 1 [Spodoptera litura]